MLNSSKLQTNNWKVRVDGLFENPFKPDLNDLTSKYSLEERIYRLRCVEAWSMVVPWIGFEMNKIIKEVKPLSKAKYVSFESILDTVNCLDKNEKL
ncbi:MAG: hypothetical protein Ct9H90mP18_01370 [Gammaproteobacteria bacterium]|nr:MAG: hypothetical protein Ct9H90mP18_01370 [Gammaproteobacteria bacterium]